MYPSIHSLGRPLSNVGVTSEVTCYHMFVDRAPIAKKTLNKDKLKLACYTLLILQNIMEQVSCQQGEFVDGACVVNRPFSCLAML